MTSIELVWEGPFQFGTSSFQDVPNEAAVYVWTVEVEDKHFVVYVGESSRLLSRWSDHLWWLLGGQYQVYDSEKLRRGEIETIYGFKGAAEHLTNFTGDFARAAFENAQIYRLWYALLPSPEFANRSNRMTVESAIHAQLASFPELANKITNGRRSVLSRNASKIQCVNRWPDGINVAGLSSGQPFQYGER